MFWCTSLLARPLSTALRLNPLPRPAKQRPCVVRWPDSRNCTSRERLTSASFFPSVFEFSLDSLVQTFQPHQLCIDNTVPSFLSRCIRWSNPMHGWFCDSPLILSKSSKLFQIRECNGYREQLHSSLFALQCMRWPDEPQNNIPGQIWHILLQPDPLPPLQSYLRTP